MGYRARLVRYCFLPQDGNKIHALADFVAEFIPAIEAYAEKFIISEEINSAELNQDKNWMTPIIQYLQREMAPRLCRGISFENKVTS